MPADYLDHHLFPVLKNWLIYGENKSNVLIAYASVLATFYGIGYPVLLSVIGSLQSKYRTERVALAIRGRRKMRGVDYLSLWSIVIILFVTGFVSNTVGSMAYIVLTTLFIVSLTGFFAYLKEVIGLVNQPSGHILRIVNSALLEPKDLKLPGETAESSLSIYLSIKRSVLEEFIRSQSYSDIHTEVRKDFKAYYECLKSEKGNERYEAVNDIDFELMQSTQVELVDDTEEEVFELPPASNIWTSDHALRQWHYHFALMFRIVLEGYDESLVDSYAQLIKKTMEQAYLAACQRPFLSREYQHLRETMDGEYAFQVRKGVKGREHYFRNLMVDDQVHVIYYASISGLREVDDQVLKSCYESTTLFAKQTGKNAAKILFSVLKRIIQDVSKPTENLPACLASTINDGEFLNKPYYLFTAKERTKLLREVQGLVSAADECDDNVSFVSFLGSMGNFSREAVLINRSMMYLVGLLIHSQEMQDRVHVIEMISREPGNVLDFSPLGEKGFLTMCCNIDGLSLYMNRHRNEDLTESQFWTLYGETLALIYIYGRHYNIPLSKLEETIKAAGWDRDNSIAKFHSGITAINENIAVIFKFFESMDKPLPDEKIDIIMFIRLQLEFK